MKPPETPLSDASRRTDDLLHEMGLGGAEHSASFASATDRMKPEHFPKSLPQGIHGGALAAIVAGVAVVAGSIYLLARHHHAKTAQQWTDRVQAEQSNPRLR